MFLNKIKSIVKDKTIINGLLFSLFSFTNKGISFFLLLILANYITPSEYGYLSLYTTFTMFLSYFIALSSPGYISFSFFQKKKEDFNIDVSAIVSITLISFIVISTIFIIFKNPIISIIKIPFEIAVIGIISSFFAVFYQIHLNLNRINENLKQYGIISCGNALLTAMLALYFVISLNTNWKGKIYAEIVSYSIFFIFSINFLLKNNYLTTKIINPKVYKEILKWSIPLIPHLATTWIKQGCDRYIIESSYTLNEVGLFSFALNIANIITMIGVSFNATNSVEIYKCLSDKNNPNINNELNNKKMKIFKLYLYISLSIIGGGILFIPYLFPMYKSSVGYFIILSFSMFLQCVYFLYSNFIFYYKKTKNLMYITFGTSLLHLILSLIITHHSLYYTCVIYVISQFTMVYLVSKLANQSINKQLYENP